MKPEIPQNRIHLEKRVVRWDWLSSVGLWEQSRLLGWLVIQPLLPPHSEVSFRRKMRKLHMRYALLDYGWVLMVINEGNLARHLQVFSFFSSS